MFTTDEYKLQDVLPYVLETGARTEAELVTVVLRLWLDERDFFAWGLGDWLNANGMNLKAWADPTLLTEDDVVRIRALVATEAGRRGFLDAIQSDKHNPVFFVLPGVGPSPTGEVLTRTPCVSGNHAAEFLLHLAMGNCGGRVESVVRS